MQTKRVVFIVGVGEHVADPRAGQRLAWRRLAIGVLERRHAATRQRREAARGKLLQISREVSRPVAVLVSPDEFDSWKETVAIQADQPLMSEIRTGLTQLKERKARLYTLEDLFD